ncbi:MAG: 30S ribosomal protein S15 [Nitrososphaeraceae archaeon]|jgi:small subunit ribosomal protein S15|nr:30S ribosomal protein S15 [Nitrososphaeraceae archaeon]
MHAHTRGKSHSTRPTSKSVPTWVSISHSDLTTNIIKMYKEDGLTASQIGIILRDEYGIPLVKPILGKTITDVLRENGIKQDMPEDLDRLVKKALGLQRHLRTHNSDRRNVRSLELIESKIHRLSRYYKTRDKIDKNWKYAAVIAQAQ